MLHFFTKIGLVLKQTDRNGGEELGVRGCKLDAILLVNGSGLTAATRQLYHVSVDKPVFQG